MEALAAISLAGNLAHFLEHALKATVKLDENLDLEEITQDFKYGFAEKLGKPQVEIDRREAKNATLEEAITILIERKHKRRRLKKELETIEEKVELEGKLEAIAKDAADSLNIIDLDLKGSDDIISSLELPLCGSRAAEEQQRSMHEDLRIASSQSGKNYAELNAKLDIALHRAQYAVNREVPIEDDDATFSYPETLEYQGEMQKFRLEGVVDHLHKMWTLEKQKAILDSQYYSQLEDREWAIHEAHGKTFEWIFEADPADNDVKKNSVNFIEWLKHGDGVFG
ncbi:hypothetical protein CGCF415_v008545 [Colletotrichum fructicola]|nr:hypothetical protein CGCF415_v008545 [Colletotrichum fructicola]KAF4938402.1 hypothetical protein CGCF245_v004563 [Colletotrichum fructicola]